MRYSTYINNQKCLEWSLNVAQGSLFDLINQAHSWATPIVIDGEVFYWMSRNNVIAQLPLFYKKADTVYRHFIALSEKGLIVYVKQGNKDLVRLTEKGKGWNDFNPDENSQKTELNTKLGNKSELTRKQIRTNSEINPTNNNISNNNVNNKSNTNKSELDILSEFNITGDLAKDFIKVRKSHKAPITKTALNGFVRESRKANISLEEAIQLAVENNWRGFKAQWFENQKASYNNNTQASVEKFSYTDNPGWSQNLINDPLSQFYQGAE